MKNTNTHTNTLTLTPEELSALIAQATAQAVAQALASVGTHTPVAPTQVQAPVQADEPVQAQARTYEHVNVGFDNFVVKAEKKVVVALVRDAYTYTGKDGKVYTVKAGTSLAFAGGHKDAWDAFKARMRKAGGTYDADAKVWAFTSPKAAKTFAEGVGATPITVEELNAVRDNWTRKSEKRAEKANKAE